MKTMKMNVWMTVAVATACVVGGVAQATAAPTRPMMTQAVKQYLNEHGDLCVGKSTWPRFVTEEDRQAGSNDALQMPVLERLGLVESTEVPSIPAAQLTEAQAKTASASAEASGNAVGPIKRYTLTAKGQQFYLQKKMSALGAHDKPIERSADFCVARLSLDKVVKWSAPEETHGHVETVVAYTYNIKSADWMNDPEARKVFPVVDRILRGERKILMTATVQAQDGKWVPVLPGQ
jgi:hypothetical protein